MKLIVIEGGDRLGKSTLIKGLCEYYNYDNVTIRHFGKPPKGMNSEEVLKFQFKAFKKEMKLFNKILDRSMNYTYYPEVVIWNRSHLGEYVYSQMFRGGNLEVLKKMLHEYEKKFISHVVYLVTLTADPNFFTSMEDGNSFSTKLEDKTRELELFKEAHEFSIIRPKLLLKVDKEVYITYRDKRIKQPLNEFRPKEDILNEVINFIK